QLDRRIRAFGSCRAAGADGPDRLVGDHNRRNVVDAVERGMYLARRHDIRFATLVLRQAFADAHDRHQGSVERRLDLAVDQRVVLEEELTPFGVSDDHESRQAFQHAGRDLAREGALRLGTQVLRANQDLRLAQTRRHGRQRRVWRADDALDAVEQLQRGQHRVDQRQAFGDGVVHLPVAGDDRFAATHQQSCFRAATPGSTLPSMNSSEAPPPVETCVSLSARPACSTAWTDSPPPTMVTAFDSAMAWATASVPLAKRGSSKTPIGPFQRTVPARVSSARNASMARGPMSTMMSSAATSGRI